MYVNEAPSGAHSEGSFEGSRSVVRPGASQSFTRASCWARFPRKSLRHFFLQNWYPHQRCRTRPNWRLQPWHLSMFPRGLAAKVISVPWVVQQVSWRVTPR